MTASFLTPDLLGGSYLYADSSSSDAVFGFMVSLTTVIDGEILEKTVNELMSRFPQFAVRAEKDGNGNCVFVKEESPVKILPSGGVEHSRLFAVSYLHKSLFFNFHRALVDERGAMAFIRAVLFRYLVCCGFEVGNDGSILTVESGFNPFEAEDAFVKMDDIPASRPIWYMDAKSFTIPAGKGAENRTTVIRIPLNKQKGRLQGYAEMATAFAAPFFSHAVQEEYYEQMADDEYIVAAIKVNLRHYFPTPSLRSFYVEAPLAYNRTIGEYPVDTVVMSQKKLLEAQLKTDALAYNAQRKISDLEKVYDASCFEGKIEAESILMQDKFMTATYSLCNIGNVIMPETLSRFVTEFYPVMPASLHPLTLTATQLHGELILAVTSDRDADSLCRRFTALLDEYDFHAYISDKFVFPFMKYLP